jgi:hypothetical protein
MGVGETDVTVSEVVARLEREIADRQKAVTMLRAICSEVMKGPRGRPRTHGSDVAVMIGRMVAEGRTQRVIAKELDLPISTVGRLAKRVGAKRSGTRGPAKKQVKKPAEKAAKGRS